MPDESYCVSLPWPVFTDKRLSATAKLLYGEISSLAQKSGYCYAKNEHFQEVLGISKREVGYCLGELCGNIRKGKQWVQGEEYIRIQFEGPRNERRIYVQTLPPGTPVPPLVTPVPPSPCTPVQPLHTCATSPLHTCATLAHLCNPPCTPVQPPLAHLCNPSIPAEPAPPEAASPIFAEGGIQLDSHKDSLSCEPANLPGETPSPPAPGAPAARERKAPAAHPPPHPEESSLSPPDTGLDETVRQELTAALTDEGCTLLQANHILHHYTPDQVRALLAQAAARRRNGERNGGMWHSAARGEWVPDLTAGQPPPDPGARAYVDSLAYQEYLRACQEEATREETAQALESARARLPWQLEATP